MKRESGHVEVLVVGAGPYGLAATAHLRAEGVGALVFGEPMSFWRDKMPSGMLLRSPWQASHIADPGHKLTLDAFREDVAPDLEAPVPLHRFVEYGRWYAEATVADADPRQIRRIRRVGDRFAATTADGESVSADRVVVGTGIGPYAYVPPALQRLGGRWVSHASEHRDFARFAGQAVAVIGGGQSALESAALLHEAGADVTVVMRRPAVRWLSRSARLHSMGPLAKLLYAPTDVGPAGLSRLVATPSLFAHVPSVARTPLTARCIRPAGAAWLIDRLADVRIVLDAEILATAIDGQHVSLRLADDSTHVVSHIVCGTGYRVDIAAAPGPLEPDLVRQVRTALGMPVLGRGFESSVPGLHFLGAPSAFSFGPLARFVAGTAFAGDELVRGVCHRRGRRR
jgi:cation diffusion facilitator CzcD-associated flavoprotein CzcO